jgi:hypothetical protein
MEIYRQNKISEQGSDYRDHRQVSDDVARKISHSQKVVGREVGV